MLPDTKPQPAFIRTEYDFTAYVRDPDNAVMPEGIEPRRMNIYAELLYNNIQEQMSTNFPVLREISPDDRWHGMIRDFMIRHRCQTPLFTEIAQEFLRYLDETRVDGSDDPPFIRELAHYEWVELALYIDDTEADRAGIDPNGDLMTGEPVVSPQAWPLFYQFDVHHISADYQPSEAPESPTYLTVYRNRDDEVGFTEINAVTYRLLTLLDSDSPYTGDEAAQQIAAELNHPDPQVVKNGAREILEGLRQREIVMGARLPTSD